MEQAGISASRILAVKMLKFLTTVSLVFVAFHYTSRLRKWADWDKSFIYKHSPGPCRQLLADGGSEDLTHIGRGLFLISSGYNFPGREVGELKLLDLSSARPEIFVLNITNPPATPGFMTSPHGIGHWKDPISGTVFVYVVTHPATEDRIEVFELRGKRSLIHIRTITDINFKYMNDLVLVGKDQFYITKFLEYRDLQRVHIDLFYPGRADVYFYDGSAAIKVASGLFMPNGINMSPDGSMVFVSDFGAKVLLGYRRDLLTNGLTKLWAEEMDTSVDNIEIDEETGDLWIGCHPIKYAMLDMYKIFNWPHPSQVLRIKLRNAMVSEVEEVYTDDGREIAGTSVASRYRKQLVIGSVWNQLIVCDIQG